MPRQSRWGLDEHADRVERLLFRRWAATEFKSSLKMVMRSFTGRALILENEQVKYVILITYINVSYSFLA